MFNFLFQSVDKKNSSLLKKANKLYKQQNFMAAVPLYQLILKNDSTHFAALANLAVCYFELEKFTEAISLFKEVIKVDSANPWWYNYLSQSYQNIDDFSSAVNNAFQAVELSSGADEHHLNMAYTLYEISEQKGKDFIEEQLQKWYRKYSQNGIVKQCYKSFHFDKDFTRSDSKYVEKLFDVFAPDFDKVLADLEYLSPLDIAESLASFYNKDSTLKIRILDIGCGSGLCGKYIVQKFPFSEIFGVDISSAMLKEAAAKNVYKKLIKDDVSDCFSRIKSKFDCLVAADVLTYFGRLDSLFVSIADSLKKGGVFSFTVSQNFINTKDFFLLPCARFVHRTEYVEKLLQKNGFFIVKNEEKVLRKEGEKDVIGKIFLAVKK